MGREIHRVPLDFGWPTNKPWKGYVPPEWRECPSDDCEHGYTRAGRWLECITHLLLMAGDASVSDRPLHPWLQAIPLRPDGAPGAEMAALTAGLAGRPPDGVFGHDALDRGAATTAIAKAAGVPDGWGVCSTCDGHAIHPDDLAASDAWERTDPPAGEGWQMWETVSEGSPVSPVFDSADGLATWLVGEGYSREGAEAFVRQGWAPTAMAVGGRFYRDVESAAPR